jgi:hypothetical protein
LRPLRVIVTGGDELLASMSLAAIAFAAPTAAQATIKLTDPAGTALAAGEKVTVTSSNLVTKTAVGTLACEKVTLHYELVAVTVNHVVLEPVVVAPATHNGTTEKRHVITAKDGVTHAVHITNAGTGQLTINTWGTGVASSTFTSNITGVAHCNYTGNVHVQAKSPGTDEATIGTSPLAGGLCGPGEISGTGTLETPNGTPITVDYVKTG